MYFNLMCSGEFCIVSEFSQERLWSRKSRADSLECTVVANLGETEKLGTEVAINQLLLRRARVQSWAFLRKNSYSP